jgi:hypothetical protein
MSKPVDHGAGTFQRRGLWGVWAAGVLLVGIGLVSWLILVGPRILVPTRSSDSLQDVSDPATRHELEDSRLKLQNDVRTTLLQGLAGIALFSGAIFTYRQLKVAREGQIAERFTRAIDQLGHENLDVRLGGIYALERVAKDSEDDRTTVAEVLCAYVRTHSPWITSPSSTATEPQPSPASVSDRRGPIQDLIVRLPDVYAATRVLGRWRGVTGSTPRLSLHNADLRRAAVRGDQLQGADFRYSNLQEADLSGADLSGAHLEGAILLGATLRDTCLRGALANEDTTWPMGFDWEARLSGT